VVDWNRFVAAEWDIAYEAAKLAAHGIAEWEAAELMWNGFKARPNKKIHGPDRYQLRGRTFGGRPLLLIVHVSGERIMRVITGWPL